jgi:hypothetical protein
MKADRENAVLSSFLYSNDMGEDTSKAFLLSEDAFTSAFRRRVATRINATTATDKAYSFLSYEIENTIGGTIYENAWLDILAQTPLPFSLARRYHNDIRKDYSDETVKDV